MKVEAIFREVHKVWFPFLKANVEVEFARFLFESIWERKKSNKILREAFSMFLSSYWH